MLHVSFVGVGEGSGGPSMTTMGMDADRLLLRFFFAHCLPVPWVFFVLLSEWCCGVKECSTLKRKGILTSVTDCIHGVGVRWLPVSVWCVSVNLTYKCCVEPDSPLQQTNSQVQGWRFVFGWVYSLILLWEWHIYLVKATLFTLLGLCLLLLPDRTLVPWGALWCISWALNI